MIKTKNKRAQLKIQQMAFVLVAMIIFFALVSLVYFSIRVNVLKRTVANLEDDKAKEVVQKLSSIPELKWENDCSSCIDLDKAIVLKNRTVYKDFFGLDYLAFEVLYPNRRDRECTAGNYPDCKWVTLTKTGNFSATTAYASFCRFDQLTNAQKCELGVIHAAGKAIMS
jgi:hypothetical protein